MNENCGNCRFVVATESGSFFCRRLPPTVDQKSGGSAPGNYPRVGSNWWCGEFEEKAEGKMLNAEVAEKQPEPSGGVYAEWSNPGRKG